MSTNFPRESPGFSMCTNFKHPVAKDGTVCVGRTMEFPDVLPWELGVLASDHVGKSESSSNGKTWTAKYGIVGVSGFGKPWFADAMNNAGAIYRLDATISDSSLAEAKAFFEAALRDGIHPAKTAITTTNIIMAI